MRFLNFLLAPRMLLSRSVELVLAITADPT
jgi:hypothetical protein